ncbi:MAG TPA: acyl-CoA dehydrogenase family protein, partial [Actinomycetota bacterium]|nr:acyl-CoA dehydrogenase family protein [Actinomycetota bacterium]
KDEYPTQIVEGMKELGLFGLTIPEEYGGLGGDYLTYVLGMEELGRADSALRGIVSVSNGLFGKSVLGFGTEEQKQKWLPRMARGEVIGCFGLTEPDVGSDPGRMRSFARRDGDDWVLSGTKMWITNGSVADLAIVWARTDDGIRGFLVPTETPGFSANDVHRKLSLRASVTSELVLNEVRLPADAVLPGVSGLKGPLSCLSEARFGIVWGSMGAARACFDSALAYATTRVQWGKPIAGFQLTQRKLADMAVELNKGTLLALHLGRMKDEGRLAPQHVSMGKLNNVREALEIAREARTILGASGITLEYPVIRHMNNLESVLTYEGTTEIHTLILGEALTGLRAYE